MAALTLFKKFLFALLLALPLTAFGQGTTEITFYGHAAFKITTPSGKVLLIDPWIDNPANKRGKEHLAKLDKVDFILVTHGHFDHVGQAVEIAKRTGAKLVATYDLGNALVQYGGFPKDQFGLDTGGNFGGEIPLLDGEVKVAFIPAVHSSTVTAPDGAKDIHDGGNPAGFLVSVRDGPGIYHTGDTDLFSDMGLIRLYRRVDVMLVAIGGHFTMGPERAAEAVKLVKPGLVIPMHYGTYPILTGTPEVLDQVLKAKKVKATVQALKPGQTAKIQIKRGGRDQTALAPVTGDEAPCNEGSVQPGRCGRQVARR